MALDTSVGGAAANSYASVAEADAYYAAHLYASGWQVATTAQKEAALIMATRILDGMPAAWTGGPASSETQALRWPRKAMKNRNGFGIATNVVPNELKNAESELAGQLLRSDPSAAGVAAAMGLTKIKIEGLQLDFHDEDITTGEAAQYLQDPSRTIGKDAQVPASVLILLVPSWLIDKRDLDAGFTGLVAEVL